MQIYSIVLSTTVHVRIIAACIGPVFIYGAIVVISKKRTWHCCKYKIAVFIKFQIFFYEISRFQIFPFGEGGEILVFDNRTEAAAAMSAIQTVDLTECFLMGFLEQ